MALWYVEHEARHISVSTSPNYNNTLRTWTQRQDLHIQTWWNDQQEVWREISLALIKKKNLLNLLYICQICEIEQAAANI